MDYGALLSRAWEIIWNNKFLIVLGIIVAIGTSSGVPSNGPESTFDSGDTGDIQPGTPPDFDFDDFEDFSRSFEDNFPLIAGLTAAILIPLICVGAIIGLAIWLAAVIARGGLIAGVDTIDGGGASSFSQAWNAAWQKGWRLVGIGVVPAIPGLVLFILGLGFTGAFFGILGMGGGRNAIMAFGGLGVALVAVICVAGLLSIILNLLMTFANRAAMLEDLGVFEAYSRGMQVLGDNIGAAIVLFLIQIVLGIIIGLLLLGPGLCCILWPVLVVINGGVKAFFSSAWTLAWREWTGRGSIVEPVAV